jgi:hypothetical protein
LEQNLIALAGLSHSGKDLLFSQFLKLARSEPNLKIQENLIYYDWINSSFKKREGSYFENMMPALSEKLLLKINTLIYVHDISYSRLEDLATDFKEIFFRIQNVNKRFQVVLLINRGHLIPNELERNKIQKNVESHLQALIPQEITSYIVSLKGPDQLRLTNLIFTQVMNRARDFRTDLRKKNTEDIAGLGDRQKKKIKKLLLENMEDCGFSGAYLVGKDQNVKVAAGKSDGWENKVGPQIIRMLAQNNVFDLGPQYQIDLIRIEDFVMLTKRLNENYCVIMIGRESVFKFDKDAYPIIEANCQNIKENLLETLK